MKREVIIFAFLLVLSGVLVSAQTYNCNDYSNGDPRKIGDVNGDGVLDVNDTALLLEIAYNLSFDINSNIFEGSWCCIDLDEDGDIIAEEDNRLLLLYVENGTSIGTCSEDACVGDCGSSPNGNSGSGGGGATFRFNVLVCRDAACTQNATTFSVGDRVYFKYVVNFGTPTISASILFPSGVKGSFSVPGSVLLQNPGNYSIDVNGSVGSRKVNIKKTFRVSGEVVTGGGVTNPSTGSPSTTGGDFSSSEEGTFWAKFIFWLLVAIIIMAILATQIVLYLNIKASRLAATSTTSSSSSVSAPNTGSTSLSSY